MTSGPAVFTIPAHRAFADALAAGLIARHRADPMALARCTILLPNNRAQRAITDAFVRAAGGGLLLPRLVAIGDPELDEQMGAFLDPIGDGNDPVPPAIAPIERVMILARLIDEARASASDPIGAAEATRLAGDLARTIDQMIIEEVRPKALAEAVAPELSAHWQASLDILSVVLDRWPEELAARGRIDLADRRNRLLARVAARWRDTPPSAPVVAAGITTSAPAVARVLRSIAWAPAGMVILPGLDQAMPEVEWRALGPLDPDPDTGRATRSIESHPQFHLKRLLDRIGVARAEVRRWRRGGGSDAHPARARAIGRAMAPAAFTAAWAGLPPAERRLSGVQVATFASPGEEAQAIAITMRGALELSGRTAALVTPDRDLARRVAALLGRWGIAVDDSAGLPLSLTPPGTLLIALAEAAAEGFAPVALLALLKHPLVRAGDGRLDWLEGARRLDRALRGPRPPAGLAGMTRYLEAGEGRDRAVRLAALPWWIEAGALLAPLEAMFDRASAKPAELLAMLRETAERLAGDAVWAGAAGRAAATWLAELEEAMSNGLAAISPAELPVLLRNMMGEVAVRPPQGGHPRLFIWGLLEARLQRADLMILGGLNEGVWPALPAPDPWLAPAIRRGLGLPGLESRIGLAAHDFAGALGAPHVLVTRAKRDARAPTVASRLWLRLQALTGGVTRDTRLEGWVRAIDRPEEYRPAVRPAPNPPVANRPRRIAVTKLDRLQADPFAFYADAMLRLAALDPVDADPSPAWRGSAVHAVLEAWMREDGCDPARLRARAEAMLRNMAAHPVLRALWQPRLIEAIDWIAAKMAMGLVAGRRPIAVELDGAATIGGIELYGKVDRIDRLADGSLAIVDYKTGQPPSDKAVGEGFAMQLGLLGLIAERGGFPGISGMPLAFEYWSLAADRKGELGFVHSPTAGRGEKIDPARFTALAARQLADSAARWLTGDEPFTAKLHPEYASYEDYDQLMRRDEWYGRTDG